MPCARLLAAIVLFWATVPCVLMAQQEFRVSGNAGSAADSPQTSQIADAADADGMQPPLDRQRRGRIRRDPYNADGSPRYTFLFGGGFTSPTGQTADSYATGFRFQGGAGRNFNRRLGIFLEFDWDGLSLRNDVLGKLLPVYQTACGNVCTGGPIAEIFGSSHVWSFTVDPVVTVTGDTRRNVYVVAGAGFYHKVTSFSAPGASSTCNGCAQYPTYDKFDRYTSNAAGFNAGVGATQQIARSDARFYAEARFVYVNNEARAQNLAKFGSGFNAFPANSQPTYMLPVTFGIRF